MADDHADLSPSLPAELRTRLDTLRRSLLRLHQVLLEDERRRYERMHGRVAGSGELLQLVIHDPWFGWLHPLSELIVHLEQVETGGAPDAVGDAQALLHQARTLLTADEQGSTFQQHYDRALQEVPDAVIAHVQTWRSLRDA